MRAIPWTQDENGLSRCSDYVDYAPKQVVDGGFFNFYELHLDLRGKLVFVLTKNGQVPVFACSNSWASTKGDTVSASIGFYGIQIGLSKESSTTLSYPSGKCQACVPLMELTNANLVEWRYYNRKKQLKARSTVRSVIRAPDCDEVSYPDCVPKPDCPGCPDNKFTAPSLHEIDRRASDGDQRTVSLAVESFESTHETSDGLLGDCYAWMNASFDAERADATSGVFVDVPWRGLTYLPPGPLPDGEGFWPAAMISAGHDVEPLGGIVLPAEEGFPLAFLMPRSEPVLLDVAYLPAGPEPPQRLQFTRSAAASLESAPMSILTAIITPTQGIGFSGGRLQFRFRDQRTDRGTIWRMPLATLATDPLGAG